MAVAHTTVNLDTDEFATLARLPGADLSKPRRKLTVVGYAMSIDEFHGHLTGLVLAETERPVEFAEQLMVALAAVGEVTQDDQFSGGGRATTSSEQLRQLLTEHQVDTPA